MTSRLSGGVPYVSGSNSTTFGADNAIWRLDTSGKTPRDWAVGGFAAGIAFDSRGDLYYDRSRLNDKLVEFTASQVRSGRARGALRSPLPTRRSCLICRLARATSA